MFKLRNISDIKSACYVYGDDDELLFGIVKGQEWVEPNF